MSDVAIERRGDDSAGIEIGMTLLGTTDMLDTVARAGKISSALMGAVVDRDFVFRFNDRDWYGADTWRLLGTFLGVTSEVEWCRPLADAAGWEARYVVRGPDGKIIGAAEAMVDRTERNWRTSSEHSLRAMAQVRAQRRALVSVLGFIPKFAGYDVADPTAPATRKQVTALHTIAAQLGWSDAERHERAGVESFNDLTRDAAGDLLDAWSMLEMPAAAEQDANLPEGDRVPPPTLEDAWASAVERHGSRVAVLKAALDRWPSDHGVSASSLTVAELTELTRSTG